MVSISQESETEIDRRLRRVLAMARLEVMPTTYAFVETRTSDPLTIHGEALAIVRDKDVWSQLVPAAAESVEPLDLWRFHFPQGVDNSGFVGWLASHIKSRLGSGVIVICGCNTNDGGVFDYWGSPAGSGSAAIALIEELAGPVCRDRKVATVAPKTS